jgi:protein SCO1/2
MMGLPLVWLSPFGCQPKRSATEKRYDLEGKVVAVEKDKKLVTVAHEDIKNLMPAMTMEFTVPAMWVYDVPDVVGKHLTATLVVDGLKTWLEDVVLSQGYATISSEGTRVEPKPGEEVPDYRLVNQDGKAIRIKDYRGKALLLTFIFTRCQMPDQCTLMSNNFAVIDQELQKQPTLRDKTHLLSVSFDPEYDTPKVLRSYGAAFTGRYSDETFSHWEFASGSADEVKGIAQFFGLHYNKDSKSGEEQIIHSLRTALIAPDGKIVKIYRGNEWKPEEVLNEMHTVFTSKSN